MSRPYRPRVTSLTHSNTPYTVTEHDEIIECDTTSGVVGVILPRASLQRGRVLTIKNLVGTSAVYICPYDVNPADIGVSVIDSSESVEGEEYYSLRGANTSVMLYSNASGWKFRAGQGVPIDGDLTVDGDGSIGDDFTVGDLLTTTAIAFAGVAETITTGTQDPWTPAAHGLLQRITPSGGIVTINGIVPINTSFAHLLAIYNVGSSNVRIQHDAAATAAYKIITDTGSLVTLTTGQIYLLLYDPIATRWRGLLKAGA